MASKKITELPSATTPIAGTEILELVQGGLNKQVPASALAGNTREFSRTFVETLVFDKNVIFHSPITMTSPIQLEIDPVGLVDQDSFMRFRLTTDGINPINFGVGFDFLYGITNGQILDAGTYEFYFLYTNGSVSVNVPGVTAQQSGATTLAAPSDFQAVADGENDIDLSWTNVSGNQGYLIEFSLDGSSGWTELETTAADATSSTQGTLSAGDIRYYRIRTLGDGSTTLNSPFTSVISAQTESGGDVTAPTFTFLPASGNTTWTVNKPITITANEPIRNTDGSEITNANVATRLTLKETNSGGANISFSATIDATKQIITITPTIIYGASQLVYVAINNVEDVNGNEVTVAISSTFTTTDFTYFDGTSNYIKFGDILDSVWTATDTIFKLRVTVNDALISGTKFLIGKYSASDNQRTFYWYYIGADVYFTYSRVLTSAHRTIRWAGALTSGEHELEMAYDGTIDTNNGLDRCVLKVDGVTAGSKTLFYNDAIALTSVLVNGGAELSFATGVNHFGNADFALYYAYEAKDLIILSGAGDTVEINVPILRTGEDVSGNNRDATWG